jgi:phage gpG-like protein
MDANDIEKLVKKAKDDILREVNDRLPREVGVIAVNHFRQNFRDGGWLDNGLHPWKRTRRQDSGGPDAKYGPLTSRRNHLMRSIQAETAPGQVTISDPVPYAAVHNDGGDITTHPTVTTKMRKFAWYMVYSIAGIRGKGKLPKELPAEAGKWKGLALTKKSRITVHAHIPQRQFMGDSAELRIKVSDRIRKALGRIAERISRFR